MKRKTEYIGTITHKKPRVSFDLSSELSTYMIYKRTNNIIHLIQQYIDSPEIEALKAGIEKARWSSDLYQSINLYVYAIIYDSIELYDLLTTKNLIPEAWYTHRCWYKLHPISAAMCTKESGKHPFLKHFLATQKLDNPEQVILDCLREAACRWTLALVHNDIFQVIFELYPSLASHPGERVLENTQRFDEQKIIEFGQQFEKNARFYLQKQNFRQNFGLFKTYFNTIPEIGTDDCVQMIGKAGIASIQKDATELQVAMSFEPETGSGKPPSPGK